MDERPVHFETRHHGHTLCGRQGFHLRFTKMRGDVTCRVCLRRLAHGAILGQLDGKARGKA